MDNPLQILRNNQEFEKKATRNTDENLQLNSATVGTGVNDLLKYIIKSQKWKN